MSEGYETALPASTQVTLTRTSAGILHFIYLVQDLNCVAERQGFEPWRRFPAYTLSRRAPSTTRPPLRAGAV